MCSDLRRLLKRKKIAQLLQQTLDEEGKTDKALTQLALKINVEAEDPVADKPVRKSPHRWRRRFCMRLEWTNLWGAIGG